MTNILTTVCATKILLSKKVTGTKFGLTYPKIIRIAFMVWYPFRSHLTKEISKSTAPFFENVSQTTTLKRAKCSAP